MNTFITHEICKLKDEDIFTGTYRLYYVPIFNFVSRLTKDEAIAEDITQDVFLKLWTKKNEFDKIDDLSRYLFTMARNRCSDHFRREKLACVIINVLPRAYGSDLNFTEQLIHQRETEAILQSAIQELSPQRKRVYVLCRIEGIEQKNVATLLGISQLTVREILRVANLQIRSKMRERTGIKRKSKRTNLQILELAG